MMLEKIGRDQVTFIMVSTRKMYRIASGMITNTGLVIGIGIEIVPSPDLEDTRRRLFDLAQAEVENSYFGNVRMMVLSDPVPFSKSSRPLQPMLDEQTTTEIRYVETPTG